jgi:hypothetical protein
VRPSRRWRQRHGGKRHADQGTSSLCSVGAVGRRFDSSAARFDFSVGANTTIDVAASADVAANDIVLSLYGNVLLGTSDTAPNSANNSATAQTTVNG